MKMNDNIEKAFALALEIEGLLQLALHRAEMLPPEALILLKAKSAELAGISAALSIEPEAVADSLSSAEPASEISPAENMGATAAEPVAAPATPEPTELQAAAEPQKSVPTDTARHDNARKEIRLTLNDRIRFRRELFHNSSDEMSQCVDVIESMGSLAEAVDYLTNDLCLDASLPAVADFIDIIEGNCFKN